MISRFFGSTYLLILKILWNWCRHKHDPSISQIFQSNFWRVFVSWPNCVAAAAAVYAKTSDAVVGSRKEGSQLADDDIFCSSFYEMPARGQLLASLLRPLLWILLAVLFGLNPPCPMISCKISGNVDQKCRFKAFFRTAEFSYSQPEESSEQVVDRGLGFAVR